MQERITLTLSRSSSPQTGLNVCESTVTGSPESGQVMQGYFGRKRASMSSNEGQIPERISHITCLR